MNKKEIILAEAKRLSGRYGYLGFTLKQLAQSCDMTAPALYYFYTSKADLFKDCLLSELEIRSNHICAWEQNAGSLTEFAGMLADEAFPALKAPVRRLTALDLPAIPFSPPLHAAHMLNVEKIAAAMQTLVAV